MIINPHRYAPWTPDLLSGTVSHYRGDDESSLTVSSTNPAHIDLIAVKAGLSSSDFFKDPGIVEGAGYPRMVNGRKALDFTVAGTVGTIYRNNTLRPITMDNFGIFLTLSRDAFTDMVILRSQVGGSARRVLGLNGSQMQVSARNGGSHVFINTIPQDTNVHNLAIMANPTTGVTIICFDDLVVEGTGAGPFSGSNSFFLGHKGATNCFDGAFCEGVFIRNYMPTMGEWDNYRKYAKLRWGTP